MRAMAAVRTWMGARGRRDAPTRAGQRGMVTVELAVGLMALGLVLACCAAVVQLVIVQGRCGDIAAQVAREIGRGDKAQESKARALAGPDDRIEVTTDGGWVEVRVVAQRSWGRIGPVTVSGRAQARVERAAVPPGAGGPQGAPAGGAEP